METVKSLVILLLVVAIAIGLITGIRKLWHRHGVASRFKEFRIALEENELRDLYDFIPPHVRQMMPYESFEGEFLDARDRIKVREVTLDEVKLKKDPRRPRAEVSFTIVQEEIKTGKKSQFQLAYDWIKLRGEWYVSLRSIRERYGQYMDEDSRFRRVSE